MNEFGTSEQGSVRVALLKVIHFRHTHVRVLVRVLNLA